MFQNYNAQHRLDKCLSTNALVHTPLPAPCAINKHVMLNHQEASMDGRIVLRKSMGSWLGYRRKDNSHEMVVTDDGIEVWRRGQRKWRVDGNGTDAPKGGKRIWGITADDILD